MNETLGIRAYEKINYNYDTENRDLLNKLDTLLKLSNKLSSPLLDIKRVPGIEGLDVTEEIYANDIYFPYRFGTGNLRYLCRK